MVQLGDKSYVAPARGALSTLTTLLSTYVEGDRAIYMYWHQDYIRWFGPNVAIGYDWLYNEGLTDSEKTFYAERLRLFSQAHLTNEICGEGCAKETYPAKNVPRLTAVQTAVVSNASAGEIYTSLLSAAASYGHNAEASAQWAQAVKKVDDWMLTGIVDGPASGGAMPEGMQYAGESYVFISSTFLAIESATGNSKYRRQLETWLGRVIEFMIQGTLPGSTSSGEFTTASMSAASTTLSVRSAAGWSVGDGVRCATGGTPGAYESTIVAISGTTFTMRDPAPITFSNQSLTHTSRWVTWGDGIQDRSNGFADNVIAEQFVTAAYIAVDVLKSAQPDTASIARHWIGREAASSNLGEVRLRRFLHDDAAVTPQPHKLPTMWGSTNPHSTGMLIGRSDWSNTGTLVQFIVGGEMYDHVHSHYNSYQIRRGGVWLSNEIYGYGINPYPGPWAKPGCSSFCLIGEAIATGARYHNTVLMNEHGGNNGLVLATELAGASSITRADVNPSGGYMYARGDASGSYTSDGWTNAGYPNNNARVFVRDFLYIPEADVVAFGDRLAYSDATVSPTKWIARFTGAPTVSGQRIVSQYAGQKIVHDVVVPEKAALTTVNEVQEYPTLDDFLTRPYFRVETVSGARAAEEWSLQIIQLGDAGLAPETTTRLTTDRINVAQVGGRFVIGVVKDAEARTEMTYRYSGTPTHYLMGFEPNTAYDVENSGGVVTIKPGGNVRSNSAGMIILNPTRRQASSGRSAPPAPANLSINR